MAEPCRLCGSLESEPVSAPSETKAMLRCQGCGLLYTPDYEGSGAGAIKAPVVQSRLKFHQVLLERLERLHPPGRLLDVGCGSGAFLELARERGWNVAGVEPYAASASLAREKKLDVFEGTLDRAPFPKDSFDVVTLWDVLDIVPDPVAVLKQSLEFLREGGTLRVRVRSARFQRFFWRLAYPLGIPSLWRIFVLHRYGFDEPQLAKALELAGFVGVRREPTPMADPRAYARGRLLGTLARFFAAILPVRPSLLFSARKPQRFARVLHLITRLDTGGSAENTLLSARGLRHRGAVLVASGPGAGGTHKDVAVVKRLVRQLSPINDVIAFFEILNLIRHWEPDIVHTHTSKAGILGRWAVAALNYAGPRRIRVVHTAHGHVFYGYFGSLKNRIFLQLERLSAPLAEKLVALTEGERRESLDFGVGSPHQWTVVPSGVDFDKVPARDEAVRRQARAAIEVKADRLVIGTIARLEPVKGVRYLIEAAAILVRQFSPPPFFLIVGGGGLRLELEQLAAELGVLPHFRFAGEQKDVFTPMQAMDIYVQPSLNEGMCKTALYAQALGLPVVASEVCGLPDVLQNGVSGFLVPPAEPAALAQVLAMLIRDKALRERLGAAGPAAARRTDEAGRGYFSVESMVGKLEKIYEELHG